MEINNEKLRTQMDQFWDNHITPTLFDYIKIPNKSPAFDKDWKRNGHMDKVLDMAKSWAEKLLPNGAELLVEETPEKTPLLLVDILGTKDGSILMYRHLDKQPEMEGWDSGLGPWTPVIKGEKYSEAKFVVTGILGPNSNAHGPIEFLHIPYAKKLTFCIASITNDFN